MDHDDALRDRCKRLWQQLGRDQVLRQNDPVETIHAFAKELIDEREYIVGFNAGFAEAEYQHQHGKPSPFAPH